MQKKRRVLEEKEYSVTETLVVDCISGILLTARFYVLFTIASVATFELVKLQCSHWRFSRTI